MLSNLRHAGLLTIAAAAMGIGSAGNAAAQGRGPAGGNGCTISANLLEADPRPDTAEAERRNVRDSVVRAPARQVERVAPSVILHASASARSVRFASQPEIRVRLCHGADSVRVVERRNLPRRVVPGTVYENVYIAVEVLAHLDGVCLAERLLGGGAPRDTSVAGDTAVRRPPGGSACAGLSASADEARDGGDPR